MRQEGMGATLGILREKWIGHPEINKLKLNLRRNMEVGLFPCYLLKNMCNLGSSPSVVSSGPLSHTAPVFSETPVHMSVQVHTCSPDTVFLSHSPFYTLSESHT